MSDPSDDSPEVSVRVVSMVASRTGAPAVILTIGDHMTQIPSAQAREIGLLLIDVAHAAEADAFFVTFSRDVIGANNQDIAVLLDAFRKYRNQNDEDEATP